MKCDSCIDGHRLHAERVDFAPELGNLMTRVLRLTLLAPDVVEAILAGRQGPKVSLAQVLALSPMKWLEHSQPA